MGLLHPSISITAPPALRVGGEDRSCVWARAARTRLRFILSVYYAQWKTIHFEPLRIDIERTAMNRNESHTLFFFLFWSTSQLGAPLNARLTSLRVPPSRLTPLDSVSCGRTCRPRASERKKERMRREREGGGGGGGLWRRRTCQRRKKNKKIFSPPFHQCECSMRRADNEARSPALGAIRMQSGGFHVIRINN